MSTVLVVLSKFGENKRPHCSRLRRASGAGAAAGAAHHPAFQHPHRSPGTTAFLPKGCRIGKKTSEGRGPPKRHVPKVTAGLTCGNSFIIYLPKKRPSPIHPMNEGVIQKFKGGLLGTLTALCGSLGLLLILKMQSVLLQ